MFYQPRQDLRNFSHQVNEFNFESEDLLFQPAPLPKRWLIYLLPFILLLLVFIFSCILFFHLHFTTFKTKLHNSVHNSVLISYYKDLSAPPIRSIMLKKSSETTEQCDAGTIPETFFLYPPIRSGCLCPDGTVNNHAYCFLKSECSYIESKNSIPLSYFRKAKLCIKRYAEIEFHIKSEAACPPSYARACGSLVCLHNSLGISGSNVLTAINEAAMDSAVDKSFDQSDRTRKKYKFGFSCTDDSNDIIAVRAGFGDAPCSSDKKPGKLKKTYPLSRFKFNGCGKYGVKPYAYKLAKTATDLEERAQDFFVQNNFIAAIGDPAISYDSIRDWPRFAEYLETTDKVDLYKVMRPKVGADANCLKWNRKLFSGENISFHKIFQVIESLSLVLIIISAVGLVIILLYLCGNYIKCCERSPFRGTWLYFPVFFICFVVASLCIAQKIYFLIAESDNQLEDRVVHVTNLLNKKCFDEVPKVKIAAEKVVEIHNSDNSNISEIISGILIILAGGLLGTVYSQLEHKEECLKGEFCA